MSEEKKLAVLIDSDNVSAKYAQFVMNEVQKYGVPTYKRVYGDWEKGGNGWHAPAVNYSIMPVQQTSYVAGKNATDFSMIIDAMDILYTGNVDGFVLVTSDSDFTRLTPSRGRKACGRNRRTQNPETVHGKLPSFLLSQPDRRNGSELRRAGYQKGGADLRHR